MDISEREKEFIEQVQEVGKLTYTQEMLVRFCNFWTEADRAQGKRQKMRFEKEKVFQIKKRLITWAKNNYDNIQCYLTDSEKTIAQKKHDFAVNLEPFLEKYGRDVLNEFYRWWTQCENKPEPKMIKWESESHWELSSRLESWVRRGRNTK